MKSFDPLSPRERASAWAKERQNGDLNWGF